MKRFFSALVFALALVFVTAAAGAALAGGGRVQEGTVSAVAADKITIDFSGQHGFVVDDKVKVAGTSANATQAKRSHDVYMVGLVSEVGGNTATVTLYSPPKAKAGDRVEVRWLTHVKGGAARQAGKR